MVLELDQILWSLLQHNCSVHYKIGCKQEQIRQQKEVIHLDYDKWKKGMSSCDCKVWAASHAFLWGDVL